MAEPTLQFAHAAILVRLEVTHFPFELVECVFKEGLSRMTIMGFDGNSIDFTKSEIDENKYPEWASGIIEEVLSTIQIIINHIKM